MSAAGRTEPRRAIWGLVNDGYALVAKTPNLTHDEAFELCRVPDIGDPSAYLDHGVAYLHSPKWGHVFARYFTNAERDSAGRASLVYDVVTLDDAAFAALDNDAFAALPPVPADRRPERLGELEVPALTRRTDADVAKRRAELLQRQDPRTLATLLGAVLSGDRVLCVATGVRAETIETLTLLLPPRLRPALTFQSPTVDYPKHTPRLTITERAHALLLEREWTTVLPRDADEPRLVDATAEAERLVALGSAPERLARAWAGAALQPLSEAVSALLRMDVLHEGLRAGDLRRAVLVTARADHADERRHLAEALFASASPERVALAAGEVIRGEQRGAWAAAHVIGLMVGNARDTSAETFAAFFRVLIDQLRDVGTTADPAAADVRVMLACAAAASDDLDRFLATAHPGLPWPHAWRDGCARWVTGRSPVARLFDALAAKGATFADALDGVHAITQVAGEANATVRARAATLALTLVRRALGQRATLEPPDRLGALVDALLRAWSASTDTGATSAERAIRRFLGLGETVPSATEPRRIAADLSRAIVESPDGAGDAELTGWVVAALDRVRGGALGDITLRAIAALLEEQDRLNGRSELASHVGRVLVHFAATDGAFILRPAWLEVVRHVDDAARRELLARALGWVARGYTNGRFTVGALADACVLVAGHGGAIDDAAVELLAPQLAAATARSNPAEVAMLAATLGAVATPAAAERLTTILLGTVDDATADGIRMRRLAHALHEIERVRDEDRFADARATLRRVIARQTISPAEEQALRVFLAVEDGTVLGRLMGRMPRRFVSTGGDRA